MNRNQRGQYTLDDGKQVCFDHMGFRRAIILQANSQNISRQELMENVAEQTGISFSALKHWVQGHNAPSDLAKVQDIANALHQNMEMLLREKEDVAVNNQEMTTIRKPDSTSEKDIVRSLYEGMVDLIELFRSEHADHDGERLLKDIYKALMKARLDLSREVFGELHSFVVNYLQQMVLADSLFQIIYSEVYDDNLGDPDSILREFEENCSIEEVFLNPWMQASGLSTWFAINTRSKDAQSAANAIHEDWSSMNNPEPFIPLFYMGNLMNGAYLRLADILAHYHID